MTLSPYPNIESIQRVAQDKNCGSKLEKLATDKLWLKTGKIGSNLKKILNHKKNSNLKKISNLKQISDLKEILNLKEISELNKNL